MRGTVWYDGMGGLRQTSRRAEIGVTLTSVIGHGPVGAVDGTRSADGSRAKLVARAAPT